MYIVEMIKLHHLKFSNKTDYGLINISELEYELYIIYINNNNN